jgi:hypothetical protein
MSAQSTDPWRSSGQQGGFARALPEILVTADDDSIVDRLVFSAQALSFHGQQILFRGFSS